MKKRIVRIILSVLLIMSLSACQFGNNLEAEYTSLGWGGSPINKIQGVEISEDLINNTTPYEELITKEVDILELSETLTPYNPKIGKVMEYIGIECLRSTEMGSIYSVHKVKQGGLLYTFYWNYNRPENDSLNDLTVYTYFYVREKLSSKDFESIVPDKSTMDDVIKIDKTAQICKNMNIAISKEYSYVYPSLHYLDDGLFAVLYKNVDGEFVVDTTGLCENYDLGSFLNLARYEYCNAEILEMDWP